MILPGLLLRRFVVLLFLALVPGIAVSQRRIANPAPTPPQIPTFTVKGRVVFDNTERPVRRTQIALMQLPSDRGSERSSATDRDGRFAIDNVPTGVYFAVVNAPGIISPLAFMTLTDKGPSENYDLKEIREYCTEIVVDGGDVNVTIQRGAAARSQAK